MNDRKYGELIITLKSDLCVGSGYSYAGIVDSDSCYDECGLPFIPAKRIKGCIREAVETSLYGLYSEKDVNRVFGKGGEDHSSNFIIDNAYIEEYEKMFEYLTQKHTTEGKTCSAFDPQEVLGRFSHVIGQTRIKDGVAEEGSLRYTRVINSFSPMDGKEMVFRAEFSCHPNDWDLISNGARATRHIGLKRNRGLGNVRIEAIEINKDSENKEDLITEQSIGDGKVCLSFAIKNIQPLMLTKTKDDESQDYISGQQMLGILAGRYLGKEGNGPEDCAFKELFLDGSTLFCNLYPYDGKYTYYPAPDYLRRRKKTKKLVYTLQETTHSEYTEAGDQPKKLKGKYVAKTPDGINILEVKKDVIYHHSHKNTRQTEVGQEAGILYSVEVIRSRQMFAGSIIVKAEYSSLIKKLICQDDLYFGKSKIAQYGRCRLIKQEHVSNNRQSEYKAGTDIVVTFLSDAIFANDDGNYTVVYDDVLSAVKSALCIDGATEDISRVSSLQTTMATGYLSVWNLRRPAVPAIKAGSYLAFRLDKDMTIIPRLIGERTLEGYGMISITNASEFDFEPVKEASKGASFSLGEQLDESVKEKIDNIMIPIVYDMWLDRKINEAINGSGRVDVSNTAAGRFALMLRESLIESNDNYDLAFTKFGERIDSFKKGDTREKGRLILKRVGTIKNDIEWKIDYTCSFFKSDTELTESLSILDVQDEKREKEKRWPEYVMAILTDRKYKGR